MKTSTPTRIYITGDTYPVKEQLRAAGCRWDGDRRAWYAESQAAADKAQTIVGSPPPAYNSPPPKDLGTTDPVALAAQFGRTALAGAKVVSFSANGLAKGEDGPRNGAVRVVRGKRYVQVARTARKYVSQEWLDDMDLGHRKAGGSYQWDGVEIEPTEAETAASAAAKTAAEDKERPIRRRAEITQIVRCAENSRSEASTAGLAKLWGASRLAGSEIMYGDAGRLVYRTSSYDDGPYTWELRDPTLAAEAAALKLDF